MPPYMEAYICKYSHLGLLSACKRCASAQQNDMYASIYGGIHLYASIYGGIHLCIFPFTQCLQKVLIYGHVFTALNICIHIWRHTCCFEHMHPYMEACMLLMAISPQFSPYIPHGYAQIWVYRKRISFI